jgi:hypothetical protein
MFYRIVLTFSFVLVLNGCLSQIASLEESAKHNIGRPFGELEAVITRPESYPSRIGWKKTTYQLSNGSWTYVEPVRPDCYIHWEINSKGIIVGYKTEGNRCW